MYNKFDFDSSTEQKVWEKGRVDYSVDPSGKHYRRDECGALIKRDRHGFQGYQGWEIDHIKPKSKGGSNDLHNLQPLQWENNRSKADQYPAHNYCVVRN